MARQLLEESGVADQLNGKTIAYYESTPSIKGIGESFIDVMGQLGITIEAQKITYQEAIALQFGAHDDYDIIVGAWGSDFPDPSGNLRPNFAIGEHRGRRRERIGLHESRGSTSCSPSRTTLVDRAERARLLIEAQALIAEDAPVIAVTNPGWPLAVNKRVQGAEVGAFWYWGSLFKDIWVTQ